MHMADALLSPAVGLTMCAVSACAIAYSVKKTVAADEEKQLPYMAMTSAFVFAAQMINFTIPLTGSSGHLGGGILLAALLGPYPAYLSLCAVLAIQALFFADGGLLALGCNMFNMGVLPCLVIYPLIFRPLLRRNINKRRILLAALLTAVLSLQAGSLSVVLETLLSGVTALPFAAFLALMQPIHLAIGAVEGLATAAILCFVWQLRPELLEAGRVSAAPPGPALRQAMIFGVIAAVLIAGGLSLLASSYPDGLEWSIAAASGVEELTADGAVHQGTAALQESLSLMPDYDYAPGQSGSAPGASLAGLVGCLLIVAAAVLSGLLLRLMRRYRGGRAYR